MPVTINGTSGVTTPSIDAAAGNADLTTLSVAGNEISAVNGNWRNRIINGGMVIDQRNAGASVTGTNGLCLDRWTMRSSQTSKFTVQQNAGSVTPPAGFASYLGVTSSSAYSVLSTDYFTIDQRIEGYNTADLNWGTANAQPVTASFWVRSSLTGAFSLGITDYNGTASYGTTYQVNASNTWEYKTVSIPAAVIGTWSKTTDGSIVLIFGLGLGASAAGTPGVWAAASYRGATGATSVVGTSGATFYITGVQLEAGSVATAFERRDYGRELMMCQRYYHRQGSGLQYLQIGAFLWDGTANCSFNYQLPVTMRAIPTFSRSGGYTSSLGSPNATMYVDSQASTTKAVNLITVGGSGGTNGMSTYIRANNDMAAFFDFSAEL